MNRVILVIFTLISSTSFAQQWSEYQVDSTLTVLMPDDFMITDTLGQRIITSRLDTGLIIISVLPNKGEIAINIENEEELIESYKSIRKGIINSLHGELIKEEFSEIGGLKTIRFSSSGTMGQERQIRHYVVVFVNNTAYSISFWEPESVTSELTKTREKLFASVKFPSHLGLNDQLTYAVERSRAYKLGELIGQILVFGFTIGLAVLVSRWFSKRAKKKKAKAQQ